METVNNIATAASRAIWGPGEGQTGNETAGTEPVSGKTGNVEAGEPYDKGNDLTSSSTTNPTTSSTTHDTTSSTTGTTSSAHDPTSAVNPSTATATSSSNTDSTTKPGEAGIPTYENYQNPSTQKSVDNTSTTTPATKDTSNTTSKLTDNVPGTSFDKEPVANDNTTPAKGGVADPSTSTSTPSTGTTGPSTSDTKTSSTDTESKTEEAKEDVKETIGGSSGIQETKKEGDHAPKYDTFKSPGGPHIDHPENDGRVGPDVAKGDLKDFEEEKSAGKEDKVLAKDHAGSGGKSEDVGGVEDTKEGKEKLSLKDKIKAKLHHNK